MATRSRPRKPTKKAAAKKATAKKVANSKIQEAQKTARDTLSGQSKAPHNTSPGGVGTAAGPEKGPKPTAPQKDPNQKTYPGDPNYSKTPNRYATKPQPGDATAPTGLLAGLTTGIPADAGDKASLRAQAAARPKNPIANPKLYGVSTAKRAANLSERMTAIDASVQQSKQKGNAVWMGLDPNARTVKIRNQGPQRMNDDGSTTTQEKVGDLILTKDELLSWLSDDSKIAQIKAAAEKAGYTISSYDDVSKLWTAVVSQAASSYSLADKKVTPWALLTLRGKYLVNGKPADKVTTTTNIDEMDPAQARLMFEQTAQQALGRAPTKSEVDDFIAKAQTIARNTPAVTTTTHHMGLDGTEESQESFTKGGSDVINAKAQVAALDQARQSEDYAAYQAAGNYFPMLFQALQSPV